MALIHEFDYEGKTVSVYAGMGNKETYISLPNDLAGLTDELVIKGGDDVDTEISQMGVFAYSRLVNDAREDIGAVKAIKYIETDFAAFYNYPCQTGQTIGSIISQLRLNGLCRRFLSAYFGKSEDVSFVNLQTGEFANPPIIIE